jgi:uncharacterized protein
MRSLWRISAVVACVALICSGAITWHYVKLRAHERKLVEDLQTYRARAEQGDPNAEFNLGGMYHQGKGVPQDYAHALYWYHKAAKQNDARAQYAIGYMYAYGQGVPQNYTEALHWYRQAADQSDSKAEYSLGLTYYYGLGVH